MTVPVAWEFEIERFLFFFLKGKFSEAPYSFSLAAKSTSFQCAE